MDLLEISGLRKTYATQKAVNDISFSVAKGNIFGLLGPNGAGKTTLLRMITGIIAPDSGSVRFEGKDFDPQRDTSQIGYMPEERGLYKKMRAGEQAIYLGQLKGMSASDAERNAARWFKKLQMENWWNRKVQDLSKGMSQKLQFVTTILHDPKLIILDEPFSGLDPVNANLIKEEIFLLAQNGATIIFSTHRMEQVEEICDQIVLVNKGRKVLDGTVTAVKQEYKEHLYSLRLEGQYAGSENPAFRIVEQSAQGHLKLQLHPGHSPNDILLHFLNGGATILGFQELLPSLNEIFIRLVGNDVAAETIQA